MKLIHSGGALIVAGGLSAISVACSTPAQTAAASGAPPQVPVVAAQQRDMPLEAHYTGRVESPDRVELRPRVSGAIDAVLFKEGTVVAAGTPLFRIDPRPFEIALRRAQGERATLQASITRARSELSRALRLVSDDAISLEELERRQGEVAQLEARATVVDAAVAEAQLDLEWTTVRAPVAGRIGKAEVTTGNIVRNGPGDGTRLAILHSVDPMHIYFDLDPSTAARALALSRSAWRAFVTPLEGGATREGVVDFVDNAVGPHSGTLKVRATVRNPDGRLLPSAVARVDFQFGQATGVTLVPEVAIGTDQGRRFVLVVNNDGVLEQRAVTPGAAEGAWRAVTGTSVRPGEQVVLLGMPGLRAGMTVTAKPKVMP